MTPAPPSSSGPDQGCGRGLRAWCCYQLRLFFTALQFFTRLPMPRWVGFEPEWLRHASRYFPAVGLLVGVLCALLYGLLSLCFPQTLALLLSTAAGIYLTGALHEDGFADVCDGFGGGMQPQRVMEIMRDSRVGAFGVLGIGLLLATKIASLAFLPAAQVMPALLLAHPLSRALAAALIWRMDYVREQGKAKPLAQQMTTPEFAVAALTALAPVLLCVMLDWLSFLSIMWALLLALAATLFLARLFRRRLGGYTGDCLGAVQQLSEVAIYLGLLAAVSSSSFS
jgi:adenosylcobinamide-GDP ribazoletransferase